MLGKGGVESGEGSTASEAYRADTREHVLEHLDDGVEQYLQAL